MEYYDLYKKSPQHHIHAPWRGALLTHPPNLRGRLQASMKDPRHAVFGIGTGIHAQALHKIYATVCEVVWLDLEHSPMNRMEIFDTIQAVTAISEGRCHVICRVPKHDHTVLYAAIDAGASGIVLPHTDNVEDVKKAMNEIRYPPLGQRSYSPWTIAPGVTDKSLTEGDPFNIETSNRSIAVFAQIESVAGVKNIDAIAQAPGVDGLFFGPGDFRADAGLKMNMGPWDEPEFADAMAKYHGAGKKYNLPLMGMARAPGDPQNLLKMGYRVILMGLDTWMFSGIMAGKMKELKDAAEEVATELEKK